MAVNHHILLLTFPSQGVINPCLQFAKNLVNIGVKVTVVIAISAHRRLSVTSEAIKGLTITAFSDGYDDGFKLGHHDFHQFLNEFRNRGSLALTNLITASAQGDCPITGLVYCMNLPWPAEVARGFHIPSALLWVQPAIVFDIYYYHFNGYGDTIKKLNDDVSCSIQLPSLPKLTSRDLPSFLAPAHYSNPYNIQLPLSKQLLDVLHAESNSKILVNTFEALESQALRSITKLNLIAIGPLVPSAFLDQRDSSDTYFEWMDSKPQSSVVYVAFGTVGLVTRQQLEEVGQGLLKSGRPFLWVIKDINNGGKLSCIEELEKSGLGVIVPWCSQVKVLSHPSLGCFVTHCGWNSSLESLVCGVPVVGIPQFTDQPTNAKLLEDESATGLRAKVNEQGLVEGEEIKRCLEMVLGGGKEGEEMRRNANKWKNLAKEATTEGGSSYNNLKAFVDGF